MISLSICLLKKACPLTGGLSRNKIRERALQINQSSSLWPAAKRRRQMIMFVPGSLCVCVF